MQTAFRLGRWHRVEPSLNRIEAPDGITPIEPKAMEVLQVLAESPGRVVSKEQLIARVWCGTNVTDDVLTRCISELRRAFGDDARQPRFIETIPKRGYRLISAVTADQPIGASDERSNGAKRRRRTAQFVLTGVGALVTLVMVIAIVRNGRLDWAPILGRSPIRTVPLNGLGGVQDDPAISPDGRFVAYSANGRDAGSRQIFLQQVGGGPPLHLTSTRNADVRPAWSPDARQIAFIRRPNYATPGPLDETGIFLIPALGGPERRIVPPFLGDSYYHGSLSWSPDGTLLAYSASDTPEEPYRISILSLATGEKRLLTSPPKNALGDGRAAFSPDGTMVAFCRQTTEWVQDIYVTPLLGGQPMRLTFDKRQIRGLSWTDDGAIVFASNRGSGTGLWMVPHNGGDPVPLGGAGIEARDPTAARASRRLAYVRDVFRCSIRTATRLGSATWTTPRRLTESVQSEYSPSYSPDGKRLTFTSSQSGDWEVWIANVDGSNPIQLTSSNGPLVGMPRWSPDGRQLVFETRESGDSDLAVTDVDAARTRPLVTGHFDDKVPNWSIDGRTIYFVSNRSGAQDWQVWKVPSTGGTPTRVTEHGGFNAFESRDQRFLYYAKYFEPGLWRMPLRGGAEECVLRDLPTGYWGQWALGDDGVYFVAMDQSGAAVIHYLDFATRRRRPVMAMTGHPVVGNPGLALSADGTSLAFVQIEEWNQGVMVVDNYH